LGGLFVAPTLAATYNAEEVAFVQLLNDYRTAQGVQPLLVSDALSDAAAKHNSDMAKYGFVSHTTGGSGWFAVGASPWDRMAASGYSFNTWKGENIAVGFITAVDVFQAWKDSPGHNANMLNANFAVIGVSALGAYWTTDFGGYVDATAHNLSSPSPTTSTTALSTTTTTLTTTTVPVTTTTIPLTTTTTTAKPTTTTTQAGKYATPAAMMDAEFLRPHHSEITGAIVQQIWRTYGIAPHITLSILAAETSLGDPVQGGRLISGGSHNYGCIRAFAGYGATPWGALATGTVRVAGKDWLAWPDMQTGMTAWALYITQGPRSSPGYYMRVFANERGWYTSFGSVYFGSGVAGYSGYVANLRALDAKFVRVAALNGWRW
jgi:hypothetical protein